MIAISTSITQNAVNNETKLTTEAFLQALYQNIDEGTITLSTFGENGKNIHLPVSDLDRVAEKALKASSETDVYYGVGIRSSGLSSHKRGGKQDVTVVPAFYMELDIDGGAHQKADLPTKEEAMSILDSFTLSPGIINHSGGGFHVYYLLDEPAYIRNEEERSHIEELMKRLERVVHRMLEHKGKVADHIADLARVLRVPGTLNHKYSPAPTVKTIHYEEERYSLEEIEEAIEHYEDLLGVEEELDTPVKEVNDQPQVFSDKVLISKIRKSKQENKFSRLFDEGDIEGYPSNSEADEGLAYLLAWWTKSSEQIERIMRNSALYREKWDTHPDYLSGRTIQSALRNVKGGYRQQAKAEEEFGLIYNFETEKEKKSQKIKKGSWWMENDNKTQSFLHDRMALYILQEYNIVRYPDAHGDLHIYNKKEGIYEIDKTCRRVRSIIRKLEFLKNQKIREVQEYITDMSPVVYEESSEYAAVKNGLLKLDTMDFKEFTPDVFLTKKIPTAYNPEAYDEFAETTIHKVAEGYEPTIKNIHEMFGAALYPTLLVPKMFYLYGRSAHNGKSTLLFMIQKTFNTGGNISSVSPQRLAENSFAGSSIYGKMANIVDDLPDKLIEDGGALKSAITGGYLEIEYKGKASYSVQMDTVFITASNHYPQFREHGRQINKRLYIIPFDHNFMEDPDCISETDSMERLNTESAREYVLKLAADAVKEMTRRTGDKLTENEKVQEASQEFADMTDPLADYFSEHDKEYFEEYDGMRTYNDYLLWCEFYHIPHKIGLKNFKAAVCSRYDMVWKDKKVKVDGKWKTRKGFRPKS